LSSFSIIEEHNDFIVINKAPGINFHCEDGETGLFEEVKASLRCDSLFPVHRLDKITSGILVFAKNQQAAKDLSEQFRSRNVSKFYLAISDKKPKKKQGLIKGDMEKARRSSWKLCKSRENPAITQFFSHSIKPGMRLYLLKPRTGKTHQIRVALKSIGAPVFGDQLYGDAWTASKADRGYLHAYALSFSLKNERYSFIAPPASGELFLDEITQQVIRNKFSQPDELPWPQL